MKCIFSRQPGQTPKNCQFLPLLPLLLLPRIPPRKNQSQHKFRKPSLKWKVSIYLSLYIYVYIYDCRYAESVTNFFLILVLISNIYFSPPSLDMSSKLPGSSQMMPPPSTPATPGTPPVRKQTYKLSEQFVPELEEVVDNQSQDSSSILAEVEMDEEKEKEKPTEEVRGEKEKNPVLTPPQNTCSGDAASGAADSGATAAVSVDTSAAASSGVTPASSDATAAASGDTAAPSDDRVGEQHDEINPYQVS